MQTNTMFVRWAQALEGWGGGGGGGGGGGECRTNHVVYLCQAICLYSIVPVGGR